MLKCKIVRNDDSSVDFVENPAGNPSKLYEAALSHTDSAATALDLWSFAYSDSFKERYGEWENAEPSLGDVLNTLSDIRTENKNISNEQLFGLTNNMLGLEMENISDLYNAIQETFYSKGYFDMSAKSLKSSGLYSSAEVTNILSDPNLQDSIKETVEIFKSDYLARSPKIKRLTDASFKEETLILQDTAETVGIGKFKNIIDEETQEALSAELAGVKDRSEFEERLSSLPFEFITEQYQASKEFADDFFSYYSNLKRVPVYELNDQELTPVVENSKAMENTIVVEEDATKVKSNIDFIIKALDEVGERVDAMSAQMIEYVTNVVKSVEKQLIDFNIDIIGANEKIDTASSENFINFMENVSNFVTGLQDSKVTPEDMGAFISMVDAFMGKEVAPEVSYDTVSESQQDLTLVDVKFPAEALEMFKDHSMIETSTGYFHKIKRTNSLEDLYSQVYTLATQNPSIMPKEVFYPYAYNTNNQFDANKLSSIPAATIVDNIRKYVEKRVSAEYPFFDQNDLQDLQELYLYKVVLNHTASPETKTPVNVKNTNYLKGEFISDFYNYYLKEKFKDSFVFKNALKYFNFGDFGIGISTKNNNTKQQMHTLLQDVGLFEKFLDYAKISKNKDLDFFANIRVEERAEEKTVMEERLDAINYPETVPPFRGEYQIKDEVLGTSSTTNNFIRVSEGVFELRAKQNGVSYYEKLDQNASRYYLTTKHPKITSTTIDTKPFKNLEAVASTKVEKNNLYSRKESKQLDDAFRCN